MERVYIIGGTRSFIGVENGQFRHVPAEKLGAVLLTKLLARERIEIEDVDFVIGGNAVGAGGNITRLMALEAGLPEHIPAFTVDSQCGSGLESIALGAAKIQTGQADVVIAGGFESSSTAPKRGYNSNHPDYEGQGQEQAWYSVAKFAPGKHSPAAMLEGAERTALTEHMDRQDLNHWVMESHQKAREARDRGLLRDVIIPLGEELGQMGQGVEGKEEKDECIRDRMTDRLLNRLPTVLKNGQIITAGNACLTQDGAAFLVLASEKYLQSRQRRAKAEFLDVSEVGVDPSMSPRAVVPVIQKLLKRNHLTQKDISVFECNEAFAVIDELFARAYPEAMERYNVFGGALAYGHPYGASGGIITLHGIKALEQRGGGYGICSIAAAGGVGTGILFRSC